MSIPAIIFDLDGVITDTAKYHFQAWQSLAHHLGLELDEWDHEALKGIDRRRSLEFILAKGSLKKNEDEIQALSDKKNRHYQSLISTMSPDDILPGVMELLEQLKELNVLTGLASSSKNAQLVLEQLDIKSYFDYIADAALISKNKPHPEIFLKVASSLATPVQYCIGIEDAVAGVQAIKTAGMFAVGIGHDSVLHEADVVYNEVKNLNLEYLLQKVVDS